MIPILKLLNNELDNFENEFDDHGN
jgi:hypothetical protein